MEVRSLNSYRLSSEEQRFAMNVSMRLICIFWVKLFRQKKAKFCLFSRLKKNPVRWKTSRISKSTNTPEWKQPNFKIVKKEKFLTLLLECTIVDVVLCQVLRVSEQLRLPKVSVTLWSYPNAITKPSVSVINGNGLLFHMTQPTTRSTIKAIACSKPTISEH